MTDPFHRVLILDPRRLPAPLPRSRAERGRSILTDTVSTVEEAVRRLQGTGYDAVLVKVSRPEEVSLVVCIRKAVPKARVLAVTPEPIGPQEDPPETDAILRRCRDAVGEGRELVDRLREAGGERRRILERMLPSAGPLLAKLVPVLVESDDRHAIQLRRGFERIGLAFPHPAARTGREAMEILARNPRPKPTLILVVLQSPKGPTYEFLSWVRSRDALMNLPIFVLGASLAPGTRQQVVEAGADAYFSKPTFPGEHEEMVRFMALKWAALFESRFSSRGS